MSIETLLFDTDNSVSIIKADSMAVAAAGRTLPVEITFQLETAGQHNLRWFVQVLNSAGEAVAMTDSASQGGYRNFVDLPVKQPIAEKLGLQLPQNLSSGEYRLIAGLYNPEQEGARLVTEDGEDTVLLQQINIP